MTEVSRFRYNSKLQLNVDLTDGYVIDVKTFIDKDKKITNFNYGRKLIFFEQPSGYLYCPIRRIYYHQVVAGACKYNPRPKLLTVVDHINGDCTDNRPSNIDHVNRHINNNNKHWNPKKHDLPPGLELRKSKRGWGKRDYYCFRKCNCNVEYFRATREKEAIAWTLEFIPKYRNALKKVYLTAPDPETEQDEWRAHFRKYFIPNNEYDAKFHRKDVLALRRFPVTPQLYLKRTGDIIDYL